MARVLRQHVDVVCTSELLKPQISKSILYAKYIYSEGRRRDTCKDAREHSLDPHISWNTRDGNDSFYLQKSP